MNGGLVRHALPVFAVLLSLIFSWWAHLTEPLLNNDGILYLRTAEAFVSGGVEDAFNLYEWPWYSIAIGLLHELVGVSLPLVAHAFNAALFGLMLVGFMSLCREAGADRLTVAFAALVVLAHPELNEYRNFVIRDFGFWAFGLLSLLALMRYVRRGRLGDVLLWSGAVLAAFAFRTEALALALAGPLSLWMSQEPCRRRLAAYLRLNVVMLVLICCGAALFIAYPELLQRLTASAIYQKWSHPLLEMQSGIWRPTEETAATMLNEYADDFPMLFLLTSLAVILVTELLSALGLPLAAILAYGFWRLRPSLAARSKGPILLYAGACLLYLGAFIVFHRFLQGRHPMLLALLLMLPAPFFLRQIYEKAQAAQRQKVCLAALAVVVGICLVDGFVSFGHSKRYLNDALAWMQANAGASEAIHTNNQKIAFHSGRPVDWDQVLLFEKQGEGAINALTKPVGYWLVEVDHDDPALESAFNKEVQQGELLELSRFANKRGDRLIIYRNTGQPCQSRSSMVRFAPCSSSGKAQSSNLGGPNLGTTPLLKPNGSFGRRMKPVSRSPLPLTS